MLQAFISQTKGLISRSDIRLHIPKVIPVENYEDGTRGHLMQLRDSFGAASLNQNFILNVFMFFGMLDAYVDNNNPVLVGKTYAEKLRQMPNNSESESVLHEVYRIYKLIRNATIHNAASISRNINGNIFIQYLFRSTQHELEISDKGLELLNSITYEFISPFEPRSTTYSDALRISLLNDLRTEIKRFNDENGGLSLAITDSYSFKIVRRYRPKPVSVVLDSNNLTIRNPHPIDPMEISLSGVDYEIEIEGISYLIPSEALNNESIAINQLHVWELR